MAHHPTPGQNAAGHGRPLQVVLHCPLLCELIQSRLQLLPNLQGHNSRNSGALPHPISQPTPTHLPAVFAPPFTSSVAPSPQLRGHKNALDLVALHSSFRQRRFLCLLLLQRPLLDLIPSCIFCMKHSAP